MAGALAACLALLASATAAYLEQTDEDRWRRLTRRYWEDTYLAIGHHLTGRFPAAYRAVRGYSGPEGRGFEEVRPTLGEAADEAGIRPWQFWRTVPADLFVRPKPVPIFPRYDDCGRPLLLSLGFTLLGGISPFLLFWLGILAAAPVLAWMAAELHHAGAGVAAVALLVLLGLSPFVADVLALPYSAVGFYLVALLALVALASYVCLSPRVSTRGLLARAAAAGVVFGVSSACRASCLALLPGFLAAMAAGGFRSARGGSPAAAPGRRGLALTLAAAALFVTPYLVVRRGIDTLIAQTLADRRKPLTVPPQVHPFWHGIWIGLGDFDREKGYVWNDQAAFDAIVRAGGTPSTTTYYDPENERITRRLILGDITKDPLWFAGILLRRAAATLTQRKLWPWPPWSGRSIAPSTAPNEGHVDAYYSLAAPVDRFGVAGHDLELPVPVLLAPTLLLLGAALAARSRGRRAHALEARLGVVGCVALATLGHPVLLTTASALETEAFALTYLVGAALGLELALGRGWPARDQDQSLTAPRAALNSS